jgi:signal transduction histidine kinase
LRSFFRLKEQKDAKGTGLSLSTVETIVSAHGGEVEVQSENGKGTTFLLSLPKTSQIQKHLPESFLMMHTKPILKYSSQVV